MKLLDVMALVARFAAWLGTFAAFFIGHANLPINIEGIGLTEHGAHVFGGMACMVVYWAGTMLLFRFIKRNNATTSPSHDCRPDIPDGTDPADTQHPKWR